MLGNLLPLLLFAVLAAAYAVGRYRRATCRADRTLAAIAAAVTVAAIALSAQAVAARSIPIPPDPWHGPIAVAHLTVGVVQHLPAPPSPSK